MYRTVKTILARYGGENTLPPVLTNIKIEGIDEAPLIVFCIMNRAKKIDRCVFASKQSHSILGTSPVEPMLGPGGIEGWSYPASAFRALDGVWYRFSDSRMRDAGDPRMQEEFAETAAMYTEYIIETKCLTAPILAQMFLPDLADTQALADFCGLTEEAFTNTAAGMREKILKNLRVSLEQPSPNGIERIQMQLPAQRKNSASGLISPELLAKMGLVPESEARKAAAGKGQPAPQKQDTGAAAGPAQAQEPAAPERKKDMEPGSENRWKMPEGFPDVTALPDVRAYLAALRKYGTDAVCRFVRFTDTDFADECASAFALVAENTVKLPAGAKVYIAGSRREMKDDGMSIYVVRDYVEYGTQDFSAAKLKRAARYPEHFRALRLKADQGAFEDMVRKLGADLSRIPPAYFAQQTLLAHCRSCGDSDDGVLRPEDLSWLAPKGQQPARQQAPQQRPQPASQKQEAQQSRPAQQPQPVKPAQQPSRQPAPAARQEQPAKREQPQAQAQPAKQETVKQEPQPARQEPAAEPVKEPVKEPAPADPAKPAKEHTDFYYDNLGDIKYNSELAGQALNELAEAVSLLEQADDPRMEPLIEKYRGYLRERVVTPSYVNDFLAVSSNHRSRAYAAAYGAAKSAIAFDKEHRKVTFPMSCIGCGNEYGADVSTMSADEPVVRCTCPRCGKKEEFSI